VGWLLNARRALDQQDIQHGTITAQNAHKAKKFSVIDRHGPAKIERATARKTGRPEGNSFRSVPALIPLYKGRESRVLSARIA